MVVFGLFEGDAWGYITSNSSILKKHPFAPQYQKFSMHGAKMRKWQPQMLRGTIRERPLFKSQNLSRFLRFGPDFFYNVVQMGATFVY